MTEKLFEVALGIASPWFVREVSFDMAARTLTLFVDFKPGSRFPHPDAEGLHPVYDTTTKRYRHLNFFQHECCLEVRVPRIQLPDNSVRQVTPSWAGHLAGFTLLFEALVLTLCQQMPFAACLRRAFGLRGRQACARISRMLQQWCIHVMRSKVEPMKEVARMIRNHFEGIVA